MFLVYGGNPSTELRVECYCDAGFETDRDDTKSQTGYVFVLNGGAVDWKSSKQSTTAMSATESEYIAASEAAMEAVWIRKFISGLGIVPTINEPLNMYCDNSAAVYYANERESERARTIKDDIIISRERPAKDDACHHCKEVGHWKKNCPVYLAELQKKKKQVGSASSSDDYSRYGYVYLLKHKHEVFETFKVFKNEVENQLGKTIKAIRSDRGGEYISQEFKDYLKANGIVQQLTPLYTPQHNGVFERRNCTLLDMVRSMTNLTTLPLSFWDYALESATRILNMVPTKKVDKTPYELWYGKVPNLSYLKVWGCEALVKRDTPDKLEQRSVKCIFIGYPKETMGLLISYFPLQTKIVVAVEEDTTPSEITSNIPQEVEGFEPPQEEVIPIRRSERTHQAPNRLCLNVEVEEHSLGDLNEPTSYKAAMLDLESNKWIDAMNAEIQSMMDNMVWVLVDLPPGCKTVGSRWLFKKKTDMDGIVHVYKARLVAKGYTQLYGVDYEETFSPVADIRAIRILISIAAYYDYEIWQMDVKTTFLNGYLDEDIYMVQPEGFVDPNHPRKVCKLQRSIYGLKQASRS
ncbi:retrovirus-related pol polyprotein from transposon TNT 1-94 [Tanacetum coccineum]|uniref:Retrovirus-related pol polyprotein from transposon TNT 1-94 n=1 Tax=Tanacetum coccineum TaxID=301880 RepID=A0ABQ5BNL9_9ASTR